MFPDPRHPALPRATLASLVALLLACDISSTDVRETAIERIVLVDEEGEHWDITQAVVRYGFEPDAFLYGLGVYAPFTSPASAAPGDSGYPGPGDDFAGVFVGGRVESRAYRPDAMLDLEVVNDALLGKPLAIVIRPFRAPPYHDTSVYSRLVPMTPVHSDTVVLSPSGWVYHEESVLVDAVTGSLWYRLPGETQLTCIAGEHFTRTLAPSVSTRARWNDWHASYPQTRFILRPPPVPGLP